MSDKCDDRVSARELANTERETRLIDELLTRKWVLIEREDGHPRRVGMAGLGWRSYRELANRLQDRGFALVEGAPPGHNQPFVRLVFPGEPIY